MPLNRPVWMIVHRAPSSFRRVSEYGLSPYGRKLCSGDGETTEVSLLVVARATGIYARILWEVATLYRRHRLTQRYGVRLGCGRAGSVGLTQQWSRATVESCSFWATLPALMSTAQVEYLQIARRRQMPYYTHAVVACRVGMSI